MADVTFDKKALAANAIHEDENKRRSSSSTSVYLKPTTMRGIPLADLTPSPVIRGFYITKSEDDSTRSVIDLALQYTDNPVESQTGSTPVTDIPVTTDEIVTRAYDQNEADNLDNNENDTTTDEVTTVAYKNRNESEIIDTSTSPAVSNEDNITREEKLFISSSSTIASKDSGSVENLLDREESNISDSRPVSRRRKPSRELTYNETPNVVSTRSSARRKIGLAVNRYNEATPAIWTGRRIVARKRHRTTVSPIKNAIRRTESEFAHSTTSIFESATSTTPPSTLTLSRAFSAITTRIPPNTLEVAVSPESSNTYKKRAKFSDAEIEDPNNRAIAEAVTSTPKIVSTANPTAAVISTISDDSTVVNTRTSEVATATSPIVAIAKVPSLGSDATTTIASSNVETTFTTASNYLSDIPATTIAHANDFVTASNENESNSTTTSYLTDFTNAIETTSSIANYSEITTSVNTIAIDSSITNTEFETTFTSANYPSDTAVPTSEVETTFTKSPVTDAIPPATANTNAITTDISTSETAEDETYTNAIPNYSTVVTAAIADIDKSETDSSAIATTSAETEAISTANNFESVTFANVHTITIPITSLVPLRTVPSAADTRAYPTPSMTTSNFIDTLTTNMMTATTADSTIVPTTTDSSVIATSASADVPSTIIDTATTQSRTDSVTSAYPVTDTPLTSSISTTARVESNVLDIRNNSEILADTVTEQSTQNTPTLTSKFSSSTISETSAFSSQTDENSVTPMITRTPSILPSPVTPVAHTTTVLEEKSKSTDFFISATSYELTPTTIRTTESIYPSSRITTREESTKKKIDFPKEEATFSNDTQNKTKHAQTPTIIYDSNFKQTTSKGSTIPEKKISEETTSESTRNREQNQNQTTSVRNSTDYGQKTSRRRVINRTNNWNGWSAPQQTSHPRRVPLQRGTRRPSSHISSARTRQENLRRRIAQKRARINPEAIGSTVGSDENIVDVQNTSEESVTYDQNGRTKVSVTRVRERIDEKETATSRGTTVLPQPSTSVESKPFRDHNENVRRDRKPERVKPQTREDLVAEEIRGYSHLNNIIANNNKNLNNNNNNSNNTFTNTTITNSTTALDNNLTPIDAATDENQPNISENNSHANRNRFQQEKTNRRMRVVLKSVRPISKEENSTAEASAVSDPVNNTRGSFSSRRGRMRVVLKSIRPKEETSTIEEAELDSANENGRENLLNNHNASVNFTVENKTERIMRVVKRVRPKSEETETGTTTDKVDANSAVSPRDVTSKDLRNDTNRFEFGRRNGRKMRVVLKSVKPRLEATRTDSDSIDEDLQGSSSSNSYVHENRSDEEKGKVVSRKTEPARRDLITEETGDSPITFVSVLPPGFRENRKQKTRDGTNVLSRERAKPKSREEETEKIDAIDKNHESNISSIRSESEKEQATTEPQEDARTTEAITVLTEEDTDRFSLETTSLRNNGSSLGRKSVSGSNPVRQRKPTQPTTVSPLISTVPSYLTTTHRRVRPAIETTLSPRIDLNVFDGVSESYVKSVEDDQKTDVSDQSVRAQEFAATLANPPTSSSPNTGRTPLVDVDGRKISTTITPRTYPTTERTVTRYVADVRGRQKFRTKDNKPVTANATTRPRRPPVIDYDYYEDEVPIVIGKSFLNSKLFLTSKGTIRCLDQGNFPHPYSCKKFITCSRMVNGQVIGTEYTCPDKLSFDPIGGICNWSAGLGCKE